MNTIASRLVFLTVFSLMNSQLPSALAQGTAFVYQGRLNVGTNPADGNYDLQFTLYPVVLGGTAVAGPVTNLATSVANGLFTATIDFGPGIFNGSDYWLDIAVRTNGGGGFTELTPRQPVTPEPYAIFAESAGGLSGLSVQAETNGSPNLIGGSSLNYVLNGVYGATIGGGGSTAAYGLGYPNSSNSVAANFGTVNGGVGNLASGIASTVGGGNHNVASAGYATVPGGVNNTASGADSFAAGQQAQAAHTGAFVWADSQNAAFGSTNNDSFNVRARGGVRFVTGGAGMAVDGQSVVTLGSPNAGQFWQIAGNTGTTPGVDFIGTADNQALQIKVNNTVALQISPGASLPNIIGGLAAFNPTIVRTNVSGAVVAGGMAPSGGVNGFGGGDFHAVFDNDGTIGGGFGNKVGSDDGDPTDAAFATVAGGVFNFAANYAATVAGGDSNYAPGNRAAILGGYANQALGSLSMVGSGFQNIIQSNASYSAVVGGQQNSIGDIYSFIGSGTNNVIQSGASYSVVGGGVVNTTAAGYSSLGGGAYNAIQGGASYSSIGGGDANIIGSSDSTSVIGGGYNNSIQPKTGVGFSAQTIAGGYQNIIGGAGLLAFIGGGESNTNLASHGTIGGGSACSILAGAFSATIPGGYFNVAGGQYSFAAGTEAQALHQGAFVWADSQLTSFASTANDQVSFRCQGGVRFTSGSTAGNQTVSWSPGNGSWSFSSDRNLKEQIVPADARQVLEKVSHLPLNEWSYKGYAQRHIGPMAQDFHALFPLNESETSLNDTDLHGVALAAIQGLNQKVEEKDAEIQKLERQNDLLAKRLTDLEAMLKSLTERK